VYFVGSQKSHSLARLPETPEWGVTAEVADAKPAKTQIA